MSRPWRLALAAIALAAAIAGALRLSPAMRSRFGFAQSTVPDQARENAYRANNVGVALLEQFKFAAAATAFREALRIDPSLALAHVNLSIALFYASDLDAAEREAGDSARLLPGDPRPQYLRGLIARAHGQSDAARAAFESVLRADPRDVGAHVNLGQIELQQQQYADAIVQFRAALAEEPYNVTAMYNLGLSQTRSGQPVEGEATMRSSQTLRESGYGTTFSSAYLEQGRYAEAIASTGAERDLVDATVPDVRFAATPVHVADTAAPSSAPSPFGARVGPADLAADGRALVAALGGGVTLIDFDGDGDQDLFIVSPAGLRLLRNDGGTFVDVTRGSGLDSIASAGSLGCVAGDYDNDGRPDLLVIRYGGNLLLHNDGDGRFSDATVRSKLPPYPFLSVSAAFVDFDHDGDLDIVVAGLADLRDAARRAGGEPLVFPDELPGAPLQFIRNNGDGTFADITRDTKVSGLLHAVSVIATDFDDHRDVDLLVTRHDGNPVLLTNQRDGTFRDIGAEVGLRIDGPVVSAATADFNKDQFPDFFFGRVAAPGLFARSDGRGRFTIVPAPAGSIGASAALFIDYDNDGLLDLLTWSADGPRLFRQVADGWDDVTARALPQGAEPRARVTPARGLVAADLDEDGDTDLIAGDGQRAGLWRNDGGNRNKAMRVRLKGRASNRLGIGAAVEIRAGSLRQRIETSASTPAAAPADVLFGLGKRPGADTLRVLWPSGILQAETSSDAAAQSGSALPLRVAVEELDRKPSSCPFLYAWNGQRFAFVTDFMGGGEMGYWEAPGVRNRPDSDEYVRIRADQLRPKNGRYELRVTNELEEAMFVDRLQLVAITHPADVEVFPNEGMIDPPKPFRLFGARHARAPRSVVDEHGHDVTDRIARLDRRYPDDFALGPIRGYAGEHALTIEVGAPPPELLLLTGWTDYAFSSDNVAASQRGMSLRPPRLEAQGRDGRWRTVGDDIGIPVGRPQTLVVDLRQRLPAGTTKIRLSTNMRIYWDQILIAEAAPTDGLRLDRLDPAIADLRSRGFSAELAAVPPQPVTYDYDRVSHVSPWKTPVGAYTREGGVRPLVTAIDDKFVIAAPGDEIALSFDATRLAPVPAGAARTFLLFADGFSKEMDPNSASPELVEPLPFHRMSRYPYPPSEHYPDTPAHWRYRAEYNTRRVRSPFPSLDAYRSIAAGSAPR